MSAAVQHVGVLIFIILRLTSSLCVYIHIHIFIKKVFYTKCIVFVLNDYTVISKIYKQCKLCVILRTYGEEGMNLLNPLSLLKFTEKNYPNQFQV